MNYKAYIKLISFFAFYITYSNYPSNAELSYNFTTKKIENGITKQQENSLITVRDDKNKYFYNFNDDKQNNNTNQQTKEKDNKKIQPTGDKENEVKLKIGGLAEAQYFYTNELSEYKQDILPNGLPQSPAEIKNYSVSNGNQHTINMLGRIDVNVEFNRYKTTDGINTIPKQRMLTVGVKLSQPFYNASKNTDPRLAPQEYIYVKTNYLQFQIGAVNSASSKMRVDAQSLASGNGGVYGNWWRYISFPVFNKQGVSANDLQVLNAMSPVYILYPTLPNEAGFTTQRTSIGQSLDGRNIANQADILYGSMAQGYPTQGAYSNKISMYFPRIKGISFGISYSPTTQYTGFITRGLNNKTPTYANISGGFVKNYTSVAIDYKKQFDKYGLGFAISATYEYGEASPLKYAYSANGNTYSSIAVSGSPYYARHNLNAFNIGFKVVYKNYSLAYSYGYWGHSLLNKYIVSENNAYQTPNQSKRSYYHTAGLGANYGPIRLGATYMRSSFAGYKLDAWSIGTDFKMLSLKYLRVQPYFEYVGYIFHTQNIQLKAGDNKTYKASASRGYVITAGIRVVF